MKTVDHQQLTEKRHSPVHIKAETLPSDIKENAETLALFEKLHKSDKFTMDAAHQAFAKRVADK